MITKGGAKEEEEEKSDGLFCVFDPETNQHSRLELKGDCVVSIKTIEKR